jgi:hypothetical protein
VFNSTTATSSYVNLQNDFAALKVDTSYAHPDRALVFWLSGFSPDVTSPFTGAGQRTPFFNFDQTRLIYMVSLTSNTPPINSGASAYPATSGSYNSYLGLIAYVPPRGSGVPYAYVDSNTYGLLPWQTLSSTSSYYVNQSQDTPYSSLSTPTPQINSFVISSSYYNSINSATYAGTVLANTGVITPYIQDLQSVGYLNTGIQSGYQFCNPSTFQIIAAGQDGNFGNLNGATNVSSVALNVRLFPTGYGWDTTDAEKDNVANFSDKSRLGDSLP